MIYTVGGENAFVTFTGIGFDPYVMGPTMMLADNSNDSLPKKQGITVPGQVRFVMSMQNTNLSIIIKKQATLNPI